MEKLKNSSKTYRVTLINTNGDGYWNIEVKAAHRRDVSGIVRKQTSNSILRVEEVL